MTIKTHVLLSALTTAVIVGFIFLRSSGDENARLKKVMAQAEAAAEQRKAMEAEKSAQKKNQPVAKESAKPKEEKPVIPEVEKPVTPEKEVAVKEEKAETKPETAKEAKPETAKEIKPVAPAKESKAEKKAVPEDDLFPASKNIAINGDFKKGMENWRYWRLKEEEGNKLIALKEKSLIIDGQSNTLMGVAQTVKISSGTVYRISAKVRSLDFNPEIREFMGARLALNAPGQVERQIVWLYKNKDWQEQSLAFTNQYSGQATFFFHTGYTKPSAKCEVTDIRLIPAESFPKINEVASNGNFKDELKGWDFWNVKGEEASNAVSRVTDKEEACVLIKGQPGGKLMGMCQAVNLTSGTVYKLSAAAKSEDQTPKAFFGARAALFANGQKEKQLLWTYNTKGWVERELIFTNCISGPATLFFHTGYTTNECRAFFKNISLIKKY